MALGAILAWQPEVLPVWLFLLLLLFALSPKKEQLALLPYLLFSLLPIELIGRMSGASPLVPWELGKYAMIGLMVYILTIIPARRRWWLGTLLMLLMLPAMVITVTASADYFPKIVFNGFGMIALALGLVVFSNLSLTQEGIKRLLQFGVAGVAMAFVYVALNSPLPHEVVYDLKSNFSISGGFNPNQVSTILSTGFAMALSPWLMTQRSHLTSFFVGVVFLFWALLTFARGGVAAGLLVLVLIGILLPRVSLLKLRLAYRVPYLFAIGSITASLFLAANAVSEGMLLKRYQGEREEILSGKMEKSLDTYVSFRYSIVKSDIKMFVDHFPWGAGLGQSASKRLSYGLTENFSAHTEATRMLAEQGLPGLLMMLIFLGAPVWLFVQNRGNPQAQMFILFCFGLAVLHSSHSAMRTIVTPLFYSLAFLQIKRD